MTDTMALKGRNMAVSIIFISLSVLNYADRQSELERSSKVFDTNDMIVNKALDGKNCSIEKLDNKSWSECGNREYMMDCSYLGLKKVPDSFPASNETKSNICVLNLNHNYIIILLNNSFVDARHMNITDVKSLYIENCSIQYIQSNAFSMLTMLVHLSLAGNNLTWPDGFGLGVFKPLVSLGSIHVHDNNITTFKRLGREMEYMKQLKELSIGLCPNCTFDKGFENLTCLTNLSLSQTNGGEHSCFAPTVYNDTFQYVPHVQHLFIRSCNIRSIEADAFSPLKELVELDLSYNQYLYFDGMNTALYGLRNSTTLRILTVNRIHEMFGLGVMLNITDMENLRTLQSLEVLHMDLNKIEVFAENVPRMFPRTLKNITLSGNRLTYGKYVQHLIDIQGVVHMDVSQQHASYNPFFYQQFDSGTNLQLTQSSGSSVTTAVFDICNCSSAGRVCLPENIESINWSRSYIVFKINQVMPLVFCGAKHVRQIDLSFNLISSWTVIVFGLENMTDVDLSMNGCEEISPAFFATFKGLQKLNISHNRLGIAFDKIPPSVQPLIFHRLWKLESLDLSSNMITHLHDDMFHNLTNIKRLFLSDNLLTNWRTSLVKNRCLKHLSLKNNKLNGLDEATTSYLDSLTTEHCYNGVVVDLSDNPLDCDCDRLNFLKWLRDTEVKVKLSDESECSIKGKRYPFRNRADLKIIMDILESDVCKNGRWIIWVASILSVVCTGLLSAVSCTLVYKHRWKLRYLYYTRHRRHVLEGYDRLFQYDVFISYARTFGSFMKISAVPIIEGTHHLTTWVYDKDSVPGVSMAENITHAINNSKKVVLLLNRDFLKDSWCEYETNMAYVESISTNRNMMIIVMMEQITGNELPLYLQRLLTAERSMEYPENEQDEHTFWMNLAEEIKA